MRFPFNLRHFVVIYGFVTFMIVKNYMRTTYLLKNHVELTVIYTIRDGTYIVPSCPLRT